MPSDFKQLVLRGAVADLARDRLGPRRAGLRCDARNELRRRVAERVGFVLKGRLRNAALDPSGDVRDTLVSARAP